MEKKLETGLDTKRFAMNLVYSIIAFVLNLFINFFITPYITEHLGSEAYGFVKLANDFTNYATILTIALNSMASRFIMLERERNNVQSASKVYSSVAFANVILSAVLTVPSVICVIFLEKLIDIPTAMVAEVKITFAITFATFIINLAFSIFGNCFYLTNRLDINSIRTAQSNIIRVAVILVLFLAFSPRMSYLVIGSLVSTVFVTVTSFYHHKKLTPDLKFRLKDFDIKTVGTVLASGIWNSITRLSQIFSSGLDLLVTNLFIGSEYMGYLSVAKTVPNLITSFNATIANLFSPNMMSLYSKGNMELLKKTSKTAMKFMCLFVTIPNAILIVMGEEFFKLWVPEQPARLISILTVLTVVNSCITGPLQPLYQIFTITNKVRQNSIIMIVYGFLSILITYIMLKLGVGGGSAEAGLYIVCSVSLVGSIIVALFYHLPFSAKYIGLPWHTFFPEVFKGVISLAVECAVGFAVNLVLPLEKSWLLWFAGAILTAIIGFAANAVIILKKEERKILYNMVLDRIKKHSRKGATHEENSD